MNEDTVKGNWKQFSGKIKEKWGKLTDDDLLQAEGNIDHLLGKLTEYYGLAKEKAEESLKDLRAAYHGSHLELDERCTTERMSSITNRTTVRVIDRRSSSKTGG